MFNKEKYIDGKPINGIKVDFNRVNKEFKKMMDKCKAPAGLYDPTTLPLDECTWSVLMSERSSSKTTQVLLYALLINKLYGVRFAYVRKLKSQITKAMYVKLFEVINSVEYGYIPYLTDGAYDHLMVTRTKDVLYATEDEKTTSADVGVLMDVEEYARYCSAFNTTNHDIVIFDEFSWGTYTQDEFLHFCQLIATLRRERISLKIIMLSNTISPYNQYLQELGIATQLAVMHKGQRILFTTDLGTKVYAELLDVAMHKTKEFDRKALSYFGFENEGLRSLYGGEWEIKGFRHLPHSDARKIQKEAMLLEYLGYYMRPVYFEDGEAFGVLIERYTGDKRKFDVLCVDVPYNSEQTHFYSRELAQWFNAQDRDGRLYVSDNETGLAFYGMIEAMLLKR